MEQKQLKDIKNPEYQETKHKLKAFLDECGNPDVISKSHIITNLYDMERLDGQAERRQKLHVTRLMQREFGYVPYCGERGRTRVFKKAE